MDMKKTSTARILWRGILWFFIVVILFVAGFLAWQTVTEFNPEAAINLTIEGEATTIGDTLTLTTYNIGYCGLGAEMDFFYEGGTMARPTEKQLQKYEAGVIERLHDFEQSDFILLQEVDTLSRRSWYSNQFDLITGSFPDYNACFALNYEAWVPLPVTNPMGKVRAGLLTLSRAVPESAVRMAFNSGYSWPMSLFMLKRCFLITRFKTKQGNDLVLINTHNSAFSDAAEIRKTELAQLKSVMEQEYAKGNYVMIGGDWNQNPTTFDTTLLSRNYLPKIIDPPIPIDFLPEGWKFVYDSEHSTNRDVNIPYTEGITRTTLIDFFVISPNIEPFSVQAIATGFSESDHQPVTATVVLR
jgi:endonuclease/exonuclease/phosphatase family metal-dependent hydrolase